MFAIRHSTKDFIAAALRGYFEHDFGEFVTAQNNAPPVSF